jgi:predicted  nucleic acid-binding Zn-ribbon protein
MFFLFQISRKTSELDEIKQRLHSRKNQSPTTFNYLTSTQETLRDEIRILEGKADVMESQKASLQKDQVSAETIALIQARM